MKVLLAEKHGFCFGVKHAIALAQELLEQHRTVYCLGDLIHNKQVVARLANQGLKVVDSLADIPPVSQRAGDDVPTVLIRSHGCGPELLAAVEERGYHLANATCILVKRAQQLVARLHAEGFHVVVIGDPNHPETIGVISYAPGVTVIQSESDFDKLPGSGRLAVISQTTHCPDEFTRLSDLIAQRGYDEVKVVNTICHETSHRQAAALELCRKVDVMFVLGGRHSANTRELAGLCQRAGVPTRHLEGWSDFEPSMAAGATVAGVTAGASTPDWIISEFVENLRGL